MKTHNKTRLLLCCLGALILSVAVTLSVKYWPRTLSEDQCSDLYRHYAHSPGIQASFVKGFPLNDTLSIDATLLHANNSTAWLQLAKDFEFSPRPQGHTDNSENRVFLMHFSKKGQTKRVKDENPLNNDFAIISITDSNISIFHIETPIQSHYCIDYCFDNMLNLK